MDLDAGPRGGLVDKRRRAILPVVWERQQLADSLARMLGQLGLERRVKTLDLAQALRPGALSQASAEPGDHMGG